MSNRLVLNNQSINDIFTRSFLNIRLSESELFNPFEFTDHTKINSRIFLNEMLGKEVDDKYYDVLMSAVYNDSNCQYYDKDNLGDDILNFLIKENSSVPQLKDLMQTLATRYDNELTESQRSVIVKYKEARDAEQQRLSNQK